MSHRVTPRAIRRLLMEGPSVDARRAMFIMSDQAPFVHAALMAQAKEAADVFRDIVADHPPETEPLHQSVDRAMLEAADAADEAFNKALVAAYRYFLMVDRCKCRACQTDRQRTNAMWQ